MIATNKIKTITIDGIEVRYKITDGPKDNHFMVECRFDIDGKEYKAEYYLLSEMVSANPDIVEKSMPNMLLRTIRKYKKWFTIRYNYRQAEGCGVTVHPHDYIKGLGININKVEAVPMADCFFYEVDKLPRPMPHFITMSDYYIVR